jgi:hypothetical protein
MAGIFGAQIHWLLQLAPLPNEEKNKQKSHNQK